MKKYIIPLFILLSFFGRQVNAQPWMSYLPKEKAENQSVSFFEIQTAFNSYCTDKGIVKGKYLSQGKQTKAPGWKRFKRWEHYWGVRVNPVTGYFPAQAHGNIYDARQAKSKSRVVNSGHWSAMGPAYSTGGYAGVGRINCVAFHPSDSNSYWIGSPSGGVWFTNDDGENWHVLTDTNEVLGVSDIVLSSDFSSSQTLYIATGDRDGGSLHALGGGQYYDNASVGVLKSTDAGQSWQATGLRFDVTESQIIGRLLKHPDNDSVFIAGTSNGIYRSQDSAKTWKQVYSGTFIIDMEFKPHAADTIYATNSDYWDKTMVLRSVDNGETWSELYQFPDDAYRAQIAVTADDSNYIYTIVANKEGGLEGIYKSTDGGNNFTKMVDGSVEGNALLGYYSDGSGDNEGQGSYDLSIDASPLDKNIVIIGGVNAWKTIDGGTNWASCNMWTADSEYNFDEAPEVHADKHLHSFRNDGVLFETNDGGVYKSTDAGLTWTDKTNGIVISQLYRMGVSQTDSSTVIAGLQDNGTKLLIEQDWYDVTGGDGMECMVDYTNRERQFATIYYGEIYRTFDLWNDYSVISENIDDEDGGYWVTPFIQDKQDNETVYVGYSDVWKSDNSGDTFKKISSMNTPDYLRSMAISPSNSEVLYVADLSHLWLTQDGGTTWSEITHNLPIEQANITYLAVKHNDANTAWVTFGAYDGNAVFETNDAGKTWKNISMGLPQIPAMSIVQNKIVSDKVHLYLATDAGVYFKSDTNAWALYSKGLPNVVISELEIYYDKGDATKSKLRAATFGRGLWESTLVTSESKAPVAEFATEQRTIIINESVEFIDQSMLNPTSWHWTFEGGLPATSTNKNPVVQYTAAGSYDVQLKVTNSFGVDSIIKSNFVQVNGLEPVAGFTADPTSGNDPLNVKFTDNSENATAWLWDFGDGGVSTEQSPRHIYTEGVFTVKQIAKNQYGADTLVLGEMIIVIKSAIPETWKEKINLYPNPADEEFTLSLNGFENSITDLFLMDMRGRIIQHVEVETADQNTYTFNVSELATGNYYLRLQGENKVVVLDVVVQ